jgi:hypothetical protein
MLPGVAETNFAGLIYVIEDEVQLDFPANKEN